VGKNEKTINATTKSPRFVAEAEEKKRRGKSRRK